MTPRSSIKIEMINKTIWLSIRSSKYQSVNQKHNDKNKWCLKQQKWHTIS